MASRQDAVEERLNTLDDKIQALQVIFYCYTNFYTIGCDYKGKADEGLSHTMDTYIYIRLLCEKITDGIKGSQYFYNLQRRMLLK